MNFYKHYIGDFQRDTGHLSLTERGAYLALIHHYYATEKPLPTDISSLCRIAGAISKVERAAVMAVMVFFEQTDSGLMHSRIEAELEKAGDLSSKNREIAVAREAQRRAEREAQVKHETCTKRAQSVSRTEHELSTPHTPDTIPQSKSVIQPPLVKPRSGVNNQRVREESPPDGGLTDGNPLFTEFWNLYPKKVGKDAASRAFAKIKRPSETMGAIRSALAWQVESEQWTKNAGQYIPNPATYLNQGRWADEPPRSTSPPAMTAVGQRAAKAADRWLEGEGFARKGTA